MAEPAAGALGQLAITGPDARHIALVLRKCPGDVIEAALPDGTAASCKILGVEPCRIILECTGAAIVGSETKRTYSLIQCLPKGQKMDFIIEKCTELGFSYFYPAISDRCIVRQASEAKQARWRKIAHEAAKQSGRTRIPEVASTASLERALRLAAERDALLLFFWEEERSNGLRDMEDRIRQASEICIVIGPEGGFSAQEADCAAHSGAVLVSLGGRILRTETAPIAAGSAAMYIAGELGPPVV